MSASAKRRRRGADNEAALNKWLNLSQAYLVSEIGEKRVNALIVGFKRATEDDPSLWWEFDSASDPYRWLYDSFRLDQRLRH